MFSIFSQEFSTYRITEKIGFDLSQQINDGSFNLDIKKRNFTLTVRQYIDQENDQTVTVFNLSLIRRQSNLDANLTHIIRNKQCFTSIRQSNIISHKCFGGNGYGKIKVQRIVNEGIQPRNQINMLNLTNNLTRCAYSGFRGSGFHWKWVLGELSGFSKNQFHNLGQTIPMQHNIGLNFGNLFGEGQDFAFIDGQIIPIEGLTYQFDQKAPLNSIILFKATKPALQAKFKIVLLEQFKDDAGLLKLDLVKAQGVWAGWIQRKDGKRYQFDGIAGFIESGDSLF